MKILFLDISGTLTSRDFRKERSYLSIGREVDRRAVARVNRIVEATGAKIVISSDWVQHEPLVSYPEVQKMLRDHGLVAEFVGHTEQAEEHTILDRGVQIQAWLDRHPEVTGYVILDDGPIPILDRIRQRLTGVTLPPENLELGQRFIHLDDDRGLQDEHVGQAIAILFGEIRLDTDRIARLLGAEVVGRVKSDPHGWFGSLALIEEVRGLRESTEAVPRCARCGHAAAAHDEGDCAVNKHESAAGPECECEGYVAPSESEVRCWRCEVSFRPITADEQAEIDRMLSWVFTASVDEAVLSTLEEQVELKSRPEAFRVKSAFLMREDEIRPWLAARRERLTQEIVRLTSCPAATGDTRLRVETGRGVVHWCPACRAQTLTAPQGVE